MSAAYRTAPPEPDRPRWWHRLLCRLFGHLLSFDTVDAWLAGDPPRCPRCGAHRSLAMLSISELVRAMPRETLHDAGTRRLRERLRVPGPGRDVLM